MQNSRLIPIRVLEHLTGPNVAHWFPDLLLKLTKIHAAVLQISKSDLKGVFVKERGSFKKRFNLFFVHI